MEEIIIREYREYRQMEILDLYRSVGWSVYYNQPEVLAKAFRNSLCIFAAYEEGQLAGLIRAVGDGASVVFIQDVLVRPAYQRRGIGTRLMAALLDRYKNVRQIHLLTDDIPDTVAFYQAVGFTPVQQNHCIAFTRLRY